MHSVDRLERALEQARAQGWEVRQEWLGETSGGACRVGARRILFVNLSLPAAEQLTQVLEALQSAQPHSAAAQETGA